MSKRFIVILNSSTDQQKEDFLAWLREHKFGWWHWFQDSWLLKNTNGSWKASQIRDAMKDKFPGIHHLVLELEDGEGTWSGFGPNADHKNMFSWIKENWK